MAGGHRVRVMLAALAALVAVAGACGDDDAGDDADVGASPGSSAGTDPIATTTNPPDDAGGDTGDEPVAGGEATILVQSESQQLDPVLASGSSVGSDGQRLFALYGALVTYSADVHAAVPYFGSFEAEDGFTTWTLTLRPGIRFSDGTPYDADAVRLNWERLQDPENRSPSLGVASTVETMTVVDPLTLRLELVAPNAHFPNGVSRFGGMTFIASPTAIAAGHDLGNDPVGAGPFVLEEWVRDNRMVLGRSPDFVDAPLPYLDRITLRVLPDEQQRLDTFLTGAADADYTSSARTVEDGLAGGAAGYASVVVSGGQSILFNMRTAPFDDPRARRAFALGLDRAVLCEVVYGPDAVPASNFLVASSPFHTEDGALPAYDPEEAQRLFSEVAADTGGPVSFTVTSAQSSVSVQLSELVQTTLNQYDDVDVEVEVVDSPTLIGSVREADFQVAPWGFPYLDPDPGLYRAVRTDQSSNYAGYSDPEVDTALDAARASDDVAERADLYAVVYAAIADNLPFLPYVETANGYLHHDDLRGLEQWEDGILYVERLWLAA